MDNSHSPDLQRLLSVWPELSEGMRFNLLALAGLSLLKNGKMRSGFATLGSSARLRTGLFLRDTRDDLAMIGGHIVGAFRGEEQTAA